MIEAVAFALVIASLGALAAALPAARRLMLELPRGPLRTRWRYLAWSIGLLIAGEAAYLVTAWNSHHLPADLIAPALQLCASAFVLIATRISGDALASVRRISADGREDMTAALMGLPGRSHLDQRMRQEVARAQRYGLAVSVMLIDIDEFRRINEVFGHQAGDHVLSEISRIAAEALRTSDVTLRSAGEELAVILPHTPPHSAVGVAQRLRRSIVSGAREALRDVAGARRPITVTIGVAGREGTEPLAGDLIELAKQALKQGKALGGDCVQAGPVLAASASGA